MSGVELGGPRDALDILRTHLAERTHWILLGSSDIISDIETEFYSGEANADFHLLMIPGDGYLVAFFFADKTRMSWEQFQRFSGVEITIQPDKQDIMFLHDGTAETDASIAHGMRLLAMTEA